MAVDIDALVNEHVHAITRADPSISLDYLISESDYGPWGVILYNDYQFETMGLDFFESNESWKRPEAVEQYNGLVDEGYCVVIYAPSDAMRDLVAMLSTKGGKPNIRLAKIGDTSTSSITLRKAQKLQIES